MVGYSGRVAEGRHSSLFLLFKSRLLVPGERTAVHFSSVSICGMSAVCQAHEWK